VSAQPKVPALQPEAELMLLGLPPGQKVVAVRREAQSALNPVVA
jgi:hypothetical protein